MCASIKKFAFGILLLVFSNVVFAYEIEPHLKSFLIQLGKYEFVARFEAVAVVDPTEIISDLSQDDIKVIGAGYNGAAIRTKEGMLIKLSHRILGHDAIIRKAWDKLYTLPLMQQLDLPVLKEVDPDRSLNPNASQKELLGSLLWAVYFPQAVESFPDKVSKDGLGYRRKFVPGTPLDKIFKLQATAPHECKYNMQKTWQQIVKFQKLGEQMLFETGVMVDLLNPSNFIITGTFDDPIIELIDHEFVRPTPEAVTYYKAQGIQIPHFEFIDVFQFVHWPLMPEHIVFSTLWNLTYEQALNYMMVYHDLNSRDQAVERLAKVPEWKITLVEGRENYENIRRARAEARQPPSENNRYPIVCRGNLLPMRYGQ